MLRLATSRGSPLLRTRQQLPTVRFLSSAAAADAEEKPKGTPYSELIVGIPKEYFPLEKRVAATPEVRLESP